jgi:hypothetical protein
MHASPVVSPQSSATSLMSCNRITVYGLSTYHHTLDTASQYQDENEDQHYMSHCASQIKQKNAITITPVVAETDSQFFVR